MNLPFPYLDRITESTYQRTVLRMMDSNYFQFAHPLFNQFLTVLSLQQKMLKVIFAVKVILVIQVVTIFNNISTHVSLKSPVERLHKYEKHSVSLEEKDPELSSWLSQKYISWWLDNICCWRLCFCASKNVITKPARHFAHKPFKCQSHKMVEHTRTTRRLFVGLALKGLKKLLASVRNIAANLKKGYLNYPHIRERLILTWCVCLRTSMYRCMC